MAGLQTSSGKFDVLAWDQDDCVAWHTSFPGFNNQRPVAWTSGFLDANTCEVVDQFVWTTAAVHSQGGSTHVYRLNGDDGTIDEDIPIPEIGAGYFAPYGGAVDSMNNFWFITYDTDQLVKVDYETLDYTIYPVGVQCPYGFAIDSLDRPWTGEFCGGSGVFDPMTEQWTTLPGILGYGLQEDDEGVMWIGTFSPPGLRGIDIETLQEVKWIMLPTQSSRGVSVDFEGYVWFVDMQQSAWKVDTDAETWESYGGLNGPYTYSDMTGHGLNLVSGGIPQG
jgi:streptogramin lyase